MGPARRRRCVEHVRGAFGASGRLARRALGQHRSTRQKAPRGRDDEAALTADVVELARRCGRYGHRRITAPLRGAGWAVNHKKIQRLWREEGLRVPQRRRRKRLGTSTTPSLPVADAPNVVWAVDFQFDASTDGRPIKIEPNAEHPSSGGGTSRFAQASILELYDPDRSQTLTYQDEIRSWTDFVAAMTGALGAQQAVGADRIENRP